MDKLLSANTIKNVFYALGAKTSDSNYAVALLNKTSGAPAGFMDMSNLASVLGGILKIRTGSFVSTSSMDLQARSGMLFVGNSQQTGFTGCFLLKRYGCETLYDGDDTFTCTYASEGHFTLSTSITGTFDVRWVLYGVAM